MEDKALVSVESVQKKSMVGLKLVQTLLNMDSKSTHTEGAFLFLAEDNRKNKELKIFETLAKSFLNDALDNLMKKNVVKLKEEKKKNYYDAKIEVKALYLLDSVGKKHVAAQKFIQNVLTIIQKATNPEALVNIVAGPAESAGSTDTLKLCPHDEFLRLCKERAEEIYPIKKKKDRTRLALIICNTEFNTLLPRYGADIDIAGMKWLLEGLGYTVDVKENLTAKGMETALWKFAARPEHQSSDSTFLVLMSHGILDGICGTMHSEEKLDVLPYDTIFEIFNNRNCRSLMNKPKVIIVQACRGENYGEVWFKDSPGTSVVSSSRSPRKLENDAICKIHVEKDFIEFCSSTPHNVSWRDSTKGCIFITELITCFRKYSWCYHLEEIFRKVQQSFETPSARAQMPTIERVSFSRYFYLFPGH
ncbi:caspase-4-like [Carlito syrichta]|uniref:Caspase-4-like n=1 Tax=Carlito syrichta TaxID=1868482 RepID=A0A1U7TST8_CARSF|nr:caspase-4-like [Carlito syrichta]